MHHGVLSTCLPYLLMLAGSVIALRFVVAFSGARLNLAQLWRLHRDQQGSVQSLSFVLTLPLFMMILMFIVQISQLTIAQVVVEYATFAAARSAIVWIPANEATNTGEDQWEWANIIVPSAGNPKFDKIRLAAAVACMPICPSRDDGYTVTFPEITQAFQNAFYDVAPASSSNPRVSERLYNKLAYALANTDLSIQFEHPSEERDLETVWEDPGLPRPRFSSDAVPYYPREFATNEIGWQDHVEVTVVHRFALLPGPGRLLSRNVKSPSEPIDLVSQRVDRSGDTYMYPLTATVRLRNEGQKSMLPFFQCVCGSKGLD